MTQSIRLSPSRASAPFPPETAVAASERSWASALARGAQGLLGRQAGDGFWYTELEGNVSLTTETVLLYRALGLHRPAQEAGFRQYLMSAQRPDGTFSLYEGGPADLSMTVEGYWGLKLLGESVDSERMRRAREFILGAGGAQRTRVLTRIYLALFGQYPHDRLPYLPPEMMLMPAWTGLSIYELAIWARGFIVPFFILRDGGTVFPLPPEGLVGELLVRQGGQVQFPAVKAWGPLAPVLRTVEKTAKILDRLPTAVLRSRALAAAEQWVMSHQEPEGRWYTYPPIWMSILALFSRGHAVDSDPVRRGVEYLESLHWRRGEELRQMSTESSIWDTILAAQALTEAGYGDEPGVKHAARAVLATQRRERGDWQVKAAPGLEPGGFSFEQANRLYPDVDSTAEAILLLRSVDLGEDEPRKAQAITRGRTWVLGMQNRDGSWGTFDKDNTSELFSRIAFDDMDVFTDPRWPDTTGRQLEMLGQLGAVRHDPQVEAALRYLRGAQESDGSFFGRWATCYLFGTWCALRGARAVGVSLEEPWARAAFDFLTRAQNPDGGFGESNHSLSEGRYVPLGQSVASQTAWALMALLCDPRPLGPAAHRAAEWLAEHQEADGLWSEAAFTGGGLKASWYLRYHLYPAYFPLQALARYVRRLNPPSRA